MDIKHDTQHMKAEAFRDLSVLEGRSGHFLAGDPRKLVTLGSVTPSSHISSFELFDVLGLPGSFDGAYCLIQPGCLSN